MCSRGSCRPSASSAAQPRQTRRPPEGTGSPTPSVIESPRAANVVTPDPFTALPARSTASQRPMSSSLQGGPGPAAAPAPGGSALAGAQPGTGSQPGDGVGQRTGVARRHQEPGYAVADQVDRPARGGSHHRQAAGRGLLQGLAERLVRPAVHENVEAGVDHGELFPLVLAEEHGTRHGTARGRLGRARCRRHQPHAGQLATLPSSSTRFSAASLPRTRPVTPRPAPARRASARCASPGRPRLCPRPGPRSRPAGCR